MDNRVCKFFKIRGCMPVSPFWNENIAHARAQTEKQSRGQRLNDEREEET
jgi:hypothetical protein